MKVNLHGKSDSEVTSIDAATTPPRSPSRRPLYYVQSPSHSQHEMVEKMSYNGSSPSGSPPHNYQYQYQYQYHCSPVHHSRESSTSRFSASLKNQMNGWKKFQMIPDREVGDDDDEEKHLSDDDRGHLKFYVLWFVVFFVILFTIFSLILWGASLSYKPEIFVKTIEFENFKVQAGQDRTGVPTDMLTLNSTIRMLYRNPATFFGVHVKATPFQIYYYDLKVASGLMKEFYQSRKSGHMVSVVVKANQVPLYGGMPLLNGGKGQLNGVSVPLNLTFTIKSKAYILGSLVKTKFSTSVTCGVTLTDIYGIKSKVIHPQNCVYS